MILQNTDCPSPQSNALGRNSRHNSRQQQEQRLCCSNSAGYDSINTHCGVLCRSGIDRSIAGQPYTWGNHEAWSSDRYDSAIGGIMVSHCCGSGYFRTDLQRWCPRIPSHLSKLRYLEQKRMRARFLEHLLLSTLCVILGQGNTQSYLTWSGPQ